jgi:hypothetical protein
MNRSIYRFWNAPLAPAFCVAMHIVGLAVMAGWLRGGMLTEPDVAARAEYIVAHQVVWTLGWIVWMLAALSIVGFYAWWGRQLRRSAVRPNQNPASSIIQWRATIGVLLAAGGMFCDVSGEAISSMVLVDRAGSVAVDPAGFLAAERLATLLTAGAANTLYTLGGMVLMFASPNLPPWVRRAMWATWIAGFLMAASAIAGFVAGMVVSTTVLFPLLIVWVTWMGLYWRPA